MVPGPDPADIVIKKDSIIAPFTSSGKGLHNEFTERIPYSSDTDLKLKYGQSDHTVEIQVSEFVLESFNQSIPFYKKFNIDEVSNIILLGLFVHFN